MKKAALLTMLFLFVGSVANAGDYTVKRQVVGSGGFMNQHTPAGTMSGVWGQSMVGKYTPKIGDKDTKMFLGFWVPVKTTSINDVPAIGNGVYNYPNPINDITMFSFNVKEASYVTINVYNNLGMKVATVVDNQFCNSGENSIQWNVKNDIGIVTSASYNYDVLVTPIAPSVSSKSYSLRGILMIAQ